MSLETQIKIKNNPYFLKYLRENSYWYKYLNRNDIYLKYFEDQMRSDYKLTSKDRFDRFTNSISMISKFMDILK